MITQRNWKQQIPQQQLTILINMDRNVKEEMTLDTIKDDFNSVKYKALKCIQISNDKEQDFTQKHIEKEKYTS